MMRLWKKTITFRQTTEHASIVNEMRSCLTSDSELMNVAHPSVTVTENKNHVINPDVRKGMYILVSIFQSCAQMTPMTPTKMPRLSVVQNGPITVRWYRSLVSRQPRRPQTFQFWKPSLISAKTGPY